MEGNMEEDDASIYFTSGEGSLCWALKFITHEISGTTGLPKGVLCTQRQYLTNVMNVSEWACNGIFLVLTLLYRF